MKIELYTFIDLYAKGLATLANILGKGTAFAESRGFSEEEMLAWRLADDMFPLRRQAQIVCDFGQQWPARAAGLEVPASIQGDTSVSQFHEAIANAKAYLATMKPDQFAGRD